MNDQVVSKHPVIFSIAKNDVYSIRTKFKCIKRIDGSIEYSSSIDDGWRTVKLIARNKSYIERLMGQDDI